MGTDQKGHKMNTEIIYNTQQGFYWDWRVATDLFLGGAGVGAFLFAVAIDEWFKGKYERICRTAALLSPLLIAGGLLLLMLKLGRPFMAYQTMINFNPSSPLWWGGIFQPLLLIGAVIYAYMWHINRGSHSSKSRKWLGRVLTPLAIIVGTYHGLLLGINVSRPLWNTGPAVLASILGFASTGIAAVMFVHLLRMKAAGRLDDEEHVDSFLSNMIIVRNLLVTVLVLQLGTYFLWYLSLKFGNLHDQFALEAANEHYGTMFWTLGIGAGVILPLLIGGLAVLKGANAGNKYQVSTIIVTSLLILIGGFVFRLALVLGGQVRLPVNTLS
jgi:protein NrfD